VKKSDESISDEVLQKLAYFDVDCLDSLQGDGEFSQVDINLLYRIRDRMAHSYDLKHFSGTQNEKETQVKAYLRYIARKMLTEHSLRMQSESRTKNSKSFASTTGKSETVNSLPPKNAEFLLALFLSKEDQEAAIGCFTELYSKRVVRWGKSRARIWAWVQVGKTLVPVLKKVVLKVSGLIAAYEWLKHHLS